MSNRSKHVCPVGAASSLDNRIRRWIQNPRKLLEPYIEKGMSVLDLGCGPGYFTIEMAELVGRSGHVTAADLQDGMLKKLSIKIQGTELEERITLHKCGENKIGLSVPFDFVLLFYMVHEVPDAAEFFREIETILKPAGQILIVEPPIHVLRKAFEKTLRTADTTGLEVAGRPGMFPSKAAILKKARSSV